MKKTFGFILVSAIACALQSCSGDNGSNNSVDSVRQIPGYNARQIAVDTGKITTTTGSASLLENAGSGGSAVIKDTVKHTYYNGKAAPAAAPAVADTSKAVKKDSTAKK